MFFNVFVKKSRFEILPPFGQWIRRTRFVLFVQFVFKENTSAWQNPCLSVSIRVLKHTHPHGKSVPIRVPKKIFVRNAVLDDRIVVYEAMYIRSRFPEPYTRMYCQQFDNFKNVADFFEFAAKLMRR